MFEIIRVKQRTGSFNRFNNLGLRFPDVHAAEQRQRGRIHTIAHHRIENIVGFHAVFFAGREVIHAIRGRGMHNTRAGIERNVIG